MLPTRSALLVGATGLIGTHCLDLLLDDDEYHTVTTLGRRPLGRTHPKLTHHVVDFDALEDHEEVIAGQDVFCCLGTTMKNAGSEAAFRKVDFEYPLAVGHHALANGAEQYLLISSLGASPDARVFYSRVKGQIEQAIVALGYEGTYIFRPSLLLGDRKESRLGEQISELALRVLKPLLIGGLRKYRGIEARAVAGAMIDLAKQQPGGHQIYESDAIQAVFTTT